MSDALKRELEAADLRVQESIKKIKSTEYPSRREANKAIQLHHASLSTPKHLVADDNNDGRRVILLCTERHCPVRVSIRQFANGGSPYWRVYNRQGIIEEWNHGFLCDKVAAVPAKIAETLLKDDASRSKDLYLRAKKKRVRPKKSSPSLGTAPHEGGSGASDLSEKNVQNEHFPHESEARVVQDTFSDPRKAE